jgi:hypothetical protein
MTAAPDAAGWLRWSGRVGWRWACSCGQPEPALGASDAALEEAQRLAQLESWSWDLRSGEMTW